MSKLFFRLGSGCALIALLLAMAACSRSPGDAGDGDGQTVMDAAWLNYRLSEWDLAMNGFSAALQQAEEGSDEWAMALYGVATTWNLRRPGENPALATRLYRELLEKAPDSPMAPWTELALVRQIHLTPVGQEPDYPAVMKGYQHVVDTYPGHLAAKEAFIYMQSILIAELEEAPARQAVANLEDYVARETKEFVGPSYSLLTVAYNLLGEQEKRLIAEERSFETTEVDPNDPSVEFAWAYWNLAVISEFELGDFERARQYYQALLDNYPNDIRVHGSKQALKRMDQMEANIRAELEAE